MLISLPLPASSQIFFSNESIELSGKFLVEQGGLLWSIKNKTDSVIVISSNPPRSNLINETNVVDMSLTNLNGGSINFLEPIEGSICYFKRLFPREKYVYLVKLDSSILASYKDKWSIDFHYFVRPFGKMIKDGISDYDFRNTMCINKWGIIEISINVDNLQGPEIENFLFSEHFFRGCDAIKASNKKRRRKDSVGSNYLMDEHDFVQSEAQYKARIR